MKDMHQFDLDPRRQAANVMLLGIYDALGDNAGRFTCSEMEQIVDAYRAFNYNDEAEILMQMHAADDDDGDDRHVPTFDERGWVNGWKYREFCPVCDIGMDFPEDHEGCNPA